MKKIFFILILSLSLIHASDLLFKASKGKLSSTTASKLSDEQMAEIKGGVMLHLIYNYAIFNNYGQKIAHNFYYAFVLDEEEFRRGGIRYTDGYGRVQYDPAVLNDLKWLTSNDSASEYATIQINYDFQTRMINNSFVILNTSNKAHRYIVLLTLS